METFTVLGLDWGREMSMEIAKFLLGVEILLLGLFIVVALIRALGPESVRAKLNRALAQLHHSAFSR
jgi:hypothetical protein